MNVAAPPWRLRLPAPPSIVERGAHILGVHPVVAAVLWARGLRDFAALDLSPPFEPSVIPQLPAAVARLALAIERGERILVHGDHDADGITATAVLTLGLRMVGARAESFIPNRLQASHGIDVQMVDAHAAACELLITVDCGITDLEAIAALQARGVDVIITDHHTPGQALPDATVVYSKHSMRAQRGLPELTGAGLAFHVVWALHRHLGQPDPLSLSDLAAIGTVGDVAALLGENRALVHAGLLQLQQSSWPGAKFRN